MRGWQVRAGRRWASPSRNSQMFPAFVHIGVVDVAFAAQLAGFQTLCNLTEESGQQRTSDNEADSAYFAFHVPSCYLSDPRGPECLPPPGLAEEPIGIATDFVARGTLDPGRLMMVTAFGHDGPTHWKQYLFRHWGIWRSCQRVPSKLTSGNGCTV